MNVKHFQARPVRVQIAQVHGIAMAQTRVIKGRSIIVDRAGPVDDLVLAVAIHVADAEIVVSLADVAAVYIADASR